jgi:hypothetical protein
MSTVLNQPPPAPLLGRLTEVDRLRLGEALQLLLAHGSLSGLEPARAELYTWCRQNLDWLREVAALSGLQVINEHESRLVQALPTRPALTLRLRQDATIVLLALWYEYDTQIREQGATEVIVTVEQLNRLLQEKLLPDLKEPPSRGRLLEILRQAQRFNLVRLEVADEVEASQVEILPTLKRVIPFQDLADWTRTAALHHHPGAVEETAAAEAGGEA